MKKSKKFTILFVGRFDPIKGIDILLKAFTEIKNKNTTLKLIGYGYEENKLKDLVKELHIEKQIEFLGKLPQSKIIEEYYKANLLVQPSLSEGQSIVLLESYAAKLPVIATDVGDTGLIVKNHKTGYLIKPNNIDELKNSLDQALNNKQLSILGLNGYKLVKQSYSWEKSANRTFNIYKKLIKYA